MTPFLDALSRDDIKRYAFSTFALRSGRPRPALRHPTWCSRARNVAMRCP